MKLAHAKTHSRAAGAVLAVAIVLCLLIAEKSLARDAPDTRDIIRVVELQGNVELSSVSVTNWTPARTNQDLHPFDRLRTGSKSRVALRWSDRSVIAFDASTEIEILPPQRADAECGLHLLRGILSFFHRDEPGRIRMITRGAVAGVEGTEFILAVNDADRTTMSVIDGRVEFGNERAMLLLTNGEQCYVDLGHAPVRAPGFVANNLLQWSFYYPAVLDLADLPLTPEEQEALGKSLAAYRSGDLLNALAEYPSARRPSSDAERAYYASLLLSVGQVEQAEALLSSISPPHGSERTRRLADALRQLIAAVKRQPAPPIPGPRLATEFLSQSYYEQSRAIPDLSLRAALKLARQAADVSPKFGFAWERVAELEFCFGKNERALEALEKSLAQSPRNAEGLALKGFILTAQNRPAEAIAWFDRSLAVDSALGNAWLGRGLCRIRHGEAAAGREDLLVAAALEPQRAELRDYLGKSYASAKDYGRAGKELELAKKLDPNDPTAWLYSALLNQLDNRVNEAIRDLEKSESLNDNRSVYRSQLLLDQDRAVRSANLAGIYQDAGMSSWSMREAERAVNDDYANYSAHLFLANSYSHLVDPNEINLRYETAMENEFLLANLLSPAAVGTMSQTVSDQNYARLLERDRVGFASDTEFLSRGAWNNASTQYGIDGNSSWNLEEDYHSDPGQWPNNDFQQQEYTLTLKQQLTPRDGAYLQLLGYDASGGDLHQYYAPDMASPNYRFTETQEPTAVLGYHHEEGPGAHLLLLFARINDNLSFTNPAQPTLIDFTPVVKPGVTQLKSVRGITSHESFENQLTIYSGELQQIWQTPEHTTILGGRGQSGGFETSDFQDRPSQFNSFFPPPSKAAQNVDSSFQRVSLYGYHEWQIFDPLQVIGGLTYDSMRSPANAQTAPISSNEQNSSQLSPKAGLIWTPTKTTTLRFAFTRSLGGTSVDQSYQIEPSQVAGFLQSFRSIIPESVAAESPGASFETFDLALEQKFNTGTYLGLDGEILESKDREIVGAFDETYPVFPYAVPSGLREDLDYQEKTLQLTVNQLLGRDWSLGAQYRISQAALKSDFPDVPNDLVFDNFEPRQQTKAVLRQAELFVAFNHPSGFFARGEALWNDQNSGGYTPDLPGDAFWQFNAFVGYRFFHRAAELRVGLLNITGQDYRLNPLNLYQEFPYQRTLTVRLRLNF
jgi:Tfp pilus assembly protein PilF